MRGPLLSLALLLTACATDGGTRSVVSDFEINTVPPEVQEAALRKDPRLAELIERARPIPAPGLHWHTKTVRIPEQRHHAEAWEAWLYLSGSW